KKAFALLFLASALAAFGQPFSLNDIPFLSQGVVDTFIPSDRGADLVAWFRADAGTYQDFGVTPSTNTSIVDTWVNVQGNANYHMQDFANTHSPILYTNVQNGMPGIFFNGAKWWRNSSDITTPSLITLYVVGWATNLASASTAWMHGDSADADSQNLYFVYTDGKTYICESGSAADCAFP